MRRASIVVLAAMGGALAACSTILGFEDVTLGTDAGAADGAVDGGADAPRADVATDTAPDTTADAPSDGNADGADACGDTMTDKNNCGRCGHSCLGGTCSMGQCTAFKLLDGFFGTRGLAVDGTSVYFTNTDGNTVFKASKIDGSNAIKIADQPDAYAPFGIAIDATSVYWTNQVTAGEVRSCPLAGCSGPSTLIANANYPAGLLVVGNNIFWGASGDGTVGTSTLDGGSRLTLFASDAGAQPYMLANDSTYVYFTDNATNAPARRVPLGGGTVVSLASTNQSQTTGIAVGGGNVFFGGGDSVGNIWKIAVGQFAEGAHAASIASGQNAPLSLAVDANYVYWLDRGDINGLNGSIYACALTSPNCNNPIVLATQQNSPLRIAVDANAVYWTINGRTTSASEGGVWKVAKP